MNDGVLDLPSNVVIECVNHILTSSAETCGAKKKQVVSKRNGKLAWSPSFKPMVRQLKKARWNYRTAPPSKREKLQGEYKLKKKELRSAQRQLLATQRKQLHKEIMDAHEGDKVTFYKLIRRQRGERHTELRPVDFGKEDDQLEGWASYFEELATPADRDHYNEQYKNSRLLRYHLLEQQEMSMRPQVESVTERQVRKHISNLKTKKAADIYGVTGEHLKYAAEEINLIMKSITNKTLFTQKLPHGFKVGKVVPVHKKGKSPLDPNNYRRITVSSILGKVIEKELAARLKPILKPQHSKLQFGFTERCSPSNCSLLLTEAMAEAKDNGKELFIILMDAKKAFDVVWQESTLVQLNEEGVKGPLWNTFNDMYKGIESRICVNGELSRPIKELQGIRQGAETSTEMFKTRVNPLIKKITNDPDSFRIGNVKIGAPTCADDTCILAPDPIAAQTVLTLAQDDAVLQRNEFRTNKSPTI